ncbi:MAG: 5'-nucleotidase C-terminal domain-containing protein, partial [Vallitaleaceae bacterium]|nr:5'-nucleotidase C-terminal domain-containing protein [Vallitaleaceae bacterium]
MKKQVSIMLSLILLLTMVLGSSVSAESIYTVKSGDVLWKISKQYGLTYQEVADYNKLANPNLIYANQKLRIPTKDELTATENGEVNLTLLATSDLHGRIYPYEYAIDSADQDAGLAKVQTVVKAEKAANQNVILMDLGDTTQDNSADLFMDEKVHPMVDAMNYMGYDTWTLGNHEFNFEKSFLDNNIATFEGDVLAANIYKADGTRFVKPYTIIEKEGVRVAIVGIIPPHVPLWEASAPEHFEGLTFTATLEETKKVLAELEGKYDVLVGAYHIGKEGEHGYEGAAAIAEACPEFDVMFLGHAHSKISGEVINGVTLIEPGAYGWAVSKAQLTIEKKDGVISVKSVEASNLETLNVEADAEMLARYKYVHDRSLVDANTIVGKVSERYIDEVDFITGEDTVTTMATAQVKDTALMDLINEVQQFYTGADVSSAAAFKSNMNLLAGDFKKKDVANIYLYSNTLMGVNITGANLKKYMEWSANFYNTYELGDITVSFNPDIRGYNYDMFSGVTYDIDISQAEGKRIKNLMLDGKEIVDDTSYKLAVNNYRFGTLLGLELVTNDDVYFDSYSLMQDAGRIRDLIIKYITEEKDGVATPSTDNNWKIIGNEFEHELLGEAMALIQDGTIQIPTSEDGRTLNVEAVNIYDLIEEGYFPGYSVQTILHTNDVHGFYVEGSYDGMGAAKMKTYFDQMKERYDNVLVLDAGDATQGANLVTLSEGKTAIEIMNALGYDAMTAGNHEFDYGSEQLLENVDLADFPILAANIKTADGKDFLTPYVIEEINGVKVAIFGIATPETVYKSHPDNTVGLTFEDPNTVAAAMVKELTPLADVIVALVHLGDEGDLTSHKLAEAVEGIDVIIDGHSHSKYDHGMVVNNT